MWTSSKPGWLFRGTPDQLRATLDEEQRAKASADAQGSFTLPGELSGEIEHDGDVSTKLLQAFSEHGFSNPIPEEATIRKAKPADSESGERSWKVVVTHYSIEEAKLETDADARGEGRDKALRDVLVYGTVARTAEEAPPLPAAYGEARYIWYAFTAVGVCAFLALLVFKYITRAIDKGRTEQPAS